MADPYSVSAESAAFKKLHNIGAGIAQLREQGLDYSMLLPMYKAALDDYRKQGDADPDNLSSFEQFYLEAGEGVKTVAGITGTITTKLLIGAGLVAAIMVLRKFK